MDLRGLQRTWEALARQDSMWAVLTGPSGAGKAWDADAFFRTGVDEVAYILDRVRAARGTPGRQRALDFGCGVGRLTQALAAHFSRVDGVDIAPTMIERALALNRAGDRCAYHVNPAADLRLFENGTFDFLYSSITLQHMPPQFSRAYIEEFFRVTRPGGVIVFQQPAEWVGAARPRTLQIDRLPRDGCRATISAPTTLRCAPGAVLPLRILIRNEGTAVWAASDRHEDDVFAVRLGNHWRSRFGFVRQFDDRRTGLPFDIEPGDAVEVGINPVAPDRRGVYILELDLVQEHVRWFAETGSRTARIRVTVDSSLAPGEVQGLPAYMDMHAIPRPEIESLISRCGGQLLAAELDDGPGPEWSSFRYIASVRELGGAGIGTHAGDKVAHDAGPPHRELAD